MGERGIDYPRVIGGYKAMRRFLLESLESGVKAGSFLLVAGKTGSGKTRVIKALPRAIDLESLANHRGSSFGRLLDEQPSQIDFENALSISLLRLQATDPDSGGRRHVLLEDEGRLIGRLSLPDSLRAKMQTAPMLVIEESLERRVQVILEDYIVYLGRRYRSRYGSEAIDLHQQHLRSGLARIRKRLGGALYADIDRQIVSAFSSGTGEAVEQYMDPAAEHQHRQWIELLLVKYYDPMYEYQMSNRDGKVLARGTRDEIIEIALGNQVL
jgi:tRNA 2-selenouridine synthase